MANNSLSASKKAWICKAREYKKLWHLMSAKFHGRGLDLWQKTMLQSVLSKMENWDNLSYESRQSAISDLREVLEEPEGD